MWWAAGAAAAVVILALVGKWISVKLAIRAATAEHEAADLAEGYDRMRRASRVRGQPLRTGGGLRDRLRRKRGSLRGDPPEPTDGPGG